MQNEDDTLRAARYRWQKAADEFSSAYEALWGAIKPLGENKKIVYLVGDSIFQGFAFNRFERCIDTDPGPLAQIDRTFNWVAAANQIPCRCLFSGVMGTAQLLKLCSTTARNNTVALLDAGPRSDDSEALEAYFASILGTVKALGMETIAFTNFTQPSAPSSCRYNITLADRKTTGNESIRRAASKTGAQLVDLEYLGFDWEQAIGNVGCTLMLPDGVHYNVLGSLLIACALLKVSWRKSVLVLDDLWPELQRLWPFIHDTSDLPISFPQELPAIIEKIIRQQ